ncbi:hypothetical protein GCM10017044_10730 [Kordiimonas sediminis]|uniref:HTH cro/C1-type domain-containing protein n=1 Tax=Kordiimonas sediminis TaxID=1735581 RepID=A0A919E481_9PROT|nr:helix-turn-helix transcriptional regulator [Kordiimonas sediminis]GHF18075.1 hypothetical protein GCM10017044_10730 [Kordiimonas sediminis]
MRKQEWIKKLLKSKGRKLKDVAEVLGVPAPRITDILKGTREVQSDEIIPLSNLLGISAMSLLKSLEKGILVELDEEQQSRLAVAGQLMGDGSILPIPKDFPFKSIPIPPDAESRDGLHCFIMGDDCLDQEIKKGSIIIAADPKKHFFPMTPGAIFLMNLGDDRLAPRLYHQTATGEDWLIPLPSKPNPAYQAWPFSLFPTRGKRNGGQKILHTDDISLGVLWVHRRYNAD